MRLLLAPLLVLAGAVTGLAATALHERWWGLALAVAATLVALAALPAGWWSRLAFASGWVVLVAWLVVPRPEGDYVVGSGAAGYALLGLGLVVLVAGLATLPRPGGSARRVRR